MKKIPGRCLDEPSRREFLAGAAFGVATLAGPGFAAADGKKTFTILHTNDMHSAFIGLGPASDYTPFKPDDVASGSTRGVEEAATGMPSRHLISHARQP